MLESEKTSISYAINHLIGAKDYSNQFIHNETWNKEIYPRFINAIKILARLLKNKEEMTYKELLSLHKQVETELFKKRPKQEPTSYYCFNCGYLNTNKALVKKHVLKFHDNVRESEVEDFIIPTYIKNTK